MRHPLALSFIQARNVTNACSFIDALTLISECFAMTMFPTTKIINIVIEYAASEPQIWNSQDAHEHNYDWLDVI